MTAHWTHEIQTVLFEHFAQRFSFQHLPPKKHPIVVEFVFERGEVLIGGNILLDRHAMGHLAVTVTVTVGVCLCVWLSMVVSALALVIVHHSIIFWLVIDEIK